MEEITGTKVYGYRQARMMPVSEKAVYEAGYIYNSSLNPTFIPGKIYAAFYSPYSFYKRPCDADAGISTPLLRFPLFWSFMSIICPLSLIVGCVIHSSALMDICDITSSVGILSR